MATESKAGMCFTDKAIFICVSTRTSIYMYHIGRLVIVHNSLKRYRGLQLSYRCVSDLRDFILVFILLCQLYLKYLLEAYGVEVLCYRQSRHF